MSSELSVGKSLSEFHKTFMYPQGVPYEPFEIPLVKNYWTDEKPSLLALRKKLIQEEVAELMEALTTNNTEEILKELVDVVFVCAGMADTYGWDFDEAFKRVHKSNMSKVDKQGKPKYRADGKLLKGENYKPPSLFDLI